MQGKEKQPESGEKKPSGSVSALRNAAEIEAKRAREAELRERKRQAAAEDAAYHAREEYAKELAEEKVDLIRLKQGVIEDSDKVFREEAPEKHYTLLQRIGNWFYHAKWWLGIASFLVLLGAFLIYDIVTRENPDLSVLLLSASNELDYESPQLCSWLTTMSEDFNGDGEVLVKSVYIPVCEATMDVGGNTGAAYTTQLYVQFQSDTCMLVLVDAESEPYLEPDEMFVSMEKLYPECPLADGVKLHVDQTNFASLAGLSSPLKEGSYLALRKPEDTMNTQLEMQEAYRRAKALLDQIVPQLQETEVTQE